MASSHAPPRRYDQIEVGEELAPRAFDLDRAQLVRYAGASLDFNPIHWSGPAAERAGLPDVIAHGMLTMAIASRLATDWAGDPGAVVECSARFSGIVPVTVDDGAELIVGGTVAGKGDEGRVAIELRVHCGEREVLRHTQVILRLNR